MHLAAWESLPCNAKIMPAALREGQPSSWVGRSLSRETAWLP